METAPEIRPLAGHDELLAALRVRVRVFVEEQNGPLEDEPDAWDASAHHFGVFHDGQLVGTGRIYDPQFGVAKIGRVAVLPECRGRGWGTLLIRKLLDYARAAGYREVILDAQTHACPFYRRFGFEALGEEFVEAGILHQRMRLALERMKDEG